MKKTWLCRQTSAYPAGYPQSWVFDYKAQRGEAAWWGFRSGRSSWIACGQSPEECVVKAIARGFDVQPDLSDVDVVKAGEEPE